MTLFPFPGCSSSTQSLESSSLPRTRAKRGPCSTSNSPAKADLRLQSDIKHVFFSPAAFKARIHGAHMKKRRLQSSFDHDIPYNRCQQISSGQSSPPFSDHALIYSHNSSRNTPSSKKAFSDHSSQLSNCPQRQPRIKVSSLPVNSHSWSYHLEVIQEPQKAAEFRNATLSRLPVTPPIIAKLIVRDHSGNSVVPEAELPFLIAHLSLYSENGETRLDPPASNPSQRILYGNLVSSLDCLEDLSGNMGLFFIFPDVSIRWHGRFRLGISLLRISSPDADGVMRIAQQGTVLAATRSRPFDVVPRLQYSAAPLTALTRTFLRQGARMFTYMSHP